MVWKSSKKLQRAVLLVQSLGTFSNFKDVDYIIFYQIKFVKVAY